MATVFMVKNRTPHDKKPFFPDKEPEFTAIPKECVLSLTKQYYTITPFPDQDKKGYSCLRKLSLIINKEPRKCTVEPFNPTLPPTDHWAYNS